MNIEFTNIEFGHWPHPGVDKQRFGIWFSVDGMQYAMKRNESMLFWLKQFIKKLEQQERKKR